MSLDRRVMFICSAWLLVNDMKNRCNYQGLLRIKGDVSQYLEYYRVIMLLLSGFTSITILLYWNS
jgi:hypothetical protein